VPHHDRVRVAWLAVLLVAASPMSFPAAVEARTAPDVGCEPHADSAARSDALMQGRYTLEPHPTVMLASPLRWDEDPLGRRNWRFLFHSLTWVLPLVDRWAGSGDDRFLDHALSLLRSWIRKNPIDDPADRFAWNDHATSLRTIVLTCVARRISPPDWLIDAIRGHASILAGGTLYTGRGNHAVNHDLALLEAACLLDMELRQAIARDRLRQHLRRSVDEQGISDERSVWYQWYVYRRWLRAREALATCGHPVAAAYERLAAMHRLLAHATQPDGRYVMIGDTLDGAAEPMPGTIAEYAATGGARGPHPVDRVAVFDGGWAFARTGWGDERPFADESLLSLRFGPERDLHGHFEHGSVTLYGGDARQLLDPGLYGYEFDAWRDWIRSRQAHNVVHVPGARLREAAESPLVRSWSDDHGFGALVDDRSYADVSHTRRVVFSLGLGYLVVEDRIRSERRHTVQQLWHLRERTRPIVRGARTMTTHAASNVVVRQLLPVGTTTLVRGQTSPRQGWLSYRYAELVAAPVVIQEARGRSVRFLTLIVPGGAEGPDVTVRDLAITAGGFSFDVGIGQRWERVHATAAGEAIVPIP
jgi:hypothetical protein